MPRPIKWHDLTDPPTYDLLTKRPSGMWDIVHSDREGWVIKPPAFRGECRIVVGHVAREIARLQAEVLIMEHESGVAGRLSVAARTKLADALKGSGAGE